MIHGAHIIIYSKDSEADRAFFRDVLKYDSVDAGHGWLIFALPPAEAAFHPAEDTDRHELYFMCADLNAEISEACADRRFGEYPDHGGIQFRDDVLRRAFGCPKPIPE